MHTANLYTWRSLLLAHPTPIDLKWLEVDDF